MKTKTPCQMTNDELMKFNEASEPKAGPSKELFSIKPLQWRNKKQNGIMLAVASDGNKKYRVHKDYWYYSQCKHVPCDGIEDGKHQAECDFMDRVKKYLIKES